ncbi:MAG: transposase [Gemmatimonadetes bacterium]|nr:transposase [Gemmatimonadota bacterium]
MRVLFGLLLRQTQGFIQSLLDLMGLAVAVPDYSTLPRRHGSLAVVLPSKCLDQPMHLVVDSTGLKIYEEGEWKVRQHGWTKRRTWRKLHVGVNQATGEVVAQTLTSHRIDDASQVAPLLSQVDEAMGAVGGMGPMTNRRCSTRWPRRRVSPRFGRSLRCAKTLQSNSMVTARPPVGAE